MFSLVSKENNLNLSLYTFRILHLYRQSNEDLLNLCNIREEILFASTNIDIAQSKVKISITFQILSKRNFLGKLQRVSRHF